MKSRKYTHLIDITCCMVYLIASLLRLKHGNLEYMILSSVEEGMFLLLMLPLFSIINQVIFRVDIALGEKQIMVNNIFIEKSICFLIVLVYFIGSFK